MKSEVECFISVDVEASGPIPGEYSMLAPGACLVGRRDEIFYVELKPLNSNAVPDALKINGIDMVHLERSGDRPEEAMRTCRDWLKKACRGAKSVFVGYNARFDWSFVNWYMHRYLGENPFGFAPVDIKSFYMGETGCDWEKPKSSHVRPEYQPGQSGDHRALTDERAQADMFEMLRPVWPS